ncbi:DUF445 family protein [Niallia sp. Krafla_26]|uniref:DUF445 family protein n=1 Tax=Niallia sp. Krafla_26 TaxID=3064703 RepID=UPI003D17B2AF
MEEIGQSLLVMLTKPQFVDIYIFPILESFLDQLSDKSPEIDQWIQKQIILIIEENHSKIGNLVEENLNKLDNATLVDMIESHVGKDLQWIRINWVLCGFVIGIILTGIKVLFT